MHSSNLHLRESLYCSNRNCHFPVLASSAQASLLLNSLQHILLTSSDEDQKQPLFSSLSIVPNRTDSSIGKDWRTQEEQPEKESLPTTSVFRAGQSLMTKGFDAMETLSPIATLSKQSAPPAPPPLQTRSPYQSQAREDEA